MVFPQIQFSGFVLTEPTTAISDVAITILCFWIFTSLDKFNQQSTLVKPWQYFFLFMGTSTFLGAIVHGLRFYQTEETRMFTWIVMNIISGTAVFLAQIATLRTHFSNSKYNKLAHVIIATQLIGYYIILIFIKNYNVVKLQVALGMLPIMFLNFYYYSTGQLGSAWIAGGIAVSIISAVVHGLKISFSQWFNYNDISHVVLMVTFSMISYGIGKKMMNTVEVTPTT